MTSSRPFACPFPRVLGPLDVAKGPNVTLPPGPPTRYRLRRTPHAGALSTFEAIARALAILEYPEIEEPLMRALDLFVERTLVLRGGIPATTNSSDTVRSRE